MCWQFWALGALVAIFAGAGWIIREVMKAGTGGFGPFNISVVALALVLFITGVAMIFGKLEGPTAGNILIAIVGFATGVVAKKD